MACMRRGFYRVISRSLISSHTSFAQSMRIRLHGQRLLNSASSGLNGPLRTDAIDMPPIRIFVATRDGHSERIAQIISRHLSSRGIKVSLQALPLRNRHDIALGSALIVVVAAVRYGRHLREAEAFLALFNKTQSPPPLALVSVNLTARKEGRQSARDNPYLRKVIARHKLDPLVAHAVAGRLEYPKYSWFDRQMIRLIMAMTGGPTDGVSTIEYTNWTQVDNVAGEIASISGYRRSNDC
jgi:menaquinone-dependent protoporphyrinogen oxidase